MNQKIAAAAFCALVGFAAGNSDWVRDARAAGQGRDQIPAVKGQEWVGLGGSPELYRWIDREMQTVCYRYFGGHVLSCVYNNGIAR